MLDALFMARVPSKWVKVSQLVSPNMGVWFANILKRAEQFTAWLQNGRPLCFWLLGFFNPTGFLTANRQEVCRKHNKDGWALDDVITHTQVAKRGRGANVKQCGVSGRPDFSRAVLWIVRRMMRILKSGGSTCMNLCRGVWRMVFQTPEVAGQDFPHSTFHCT